LANAVERGDDVLAPPSTFVVSLEHVTLSEDEQRRMRMGQRLTLDESFDGVEVAAMDDTGGLVGILARRDESWQPQLVLPADQDSVRG